MTEFHLIVFGVFFLRLIMSNTGTALCVFCAFSVASTLRAVATKQSNTGWLGSRVVSVLDSGAEGPELKSQTRRCRVTVLLFTKQRNW